MGSYYFNRYGRNKIISIFFIHIFQEPIYIYTRIYIVCCYLYLFIPYLSFILQIIIYKRVGSNKNAY